MKRILLGAALALSLVACGAAAHDYATREELADLQWEVDQLRDRVTALELDDWPAQLGTTWPGDDGGG